MYRVCEVKGPGNVICTVVRDDDPKVTKVLHCNMIMPVDQVVFTETRSQTKKSKLIPDVTIHPDSE